MWAEPDGAVCGDARAESRPPKGGTTVRWQPCSTLRGMFVQPFYFVSYYFYWIEYDDYFFIFRRPIIAGWGRDMGMILWPFRNSIRICEWRLDRLVDPIKIRFTGSLTLRPRTCGRPVVFQLLGAPNQYRAPNLRSLWPCGNTRLISPKNTTTYQRSMHNSKRSMHNKKRSMHNGMHNSKRSMHNIMHNKNRSMTSFTNLSWTWHHRVVIHQHLLLFGRITTSLLLLLQLHHYVNL